MQIVVRQISGLGNQLFQYAAGRYYAHLYGAPLRIAVDPAAKAFSYGHPRPFLLSHLAIRAPVAELTATELFLLSSRRSLRPAVASLKRIRGVQIFEESLSQRHHLLPPAALGASTRTLFLVGYWQSYKIAESLGPALREEFAFREPASGETLAVLQRIVSAACPVSVHLRRGDYTLAAEGNRVLPLSYYAAAMNLLRRELPRPRFFVFSDDVAFARAHLPNTGDTEFVGHNTSWSAHEDLRLMSACRHHVIANSSLSWWGAWLNPRTDKRVIAPRQWLMTPDSYFPELLPPSWELLDVTS